MLDLDYFYFFRSLILILSLQTVQLFVFDMHLLLMKLPVSILNKDIAQMYQFVALSIVTFDRPCKYSSLSLSEQCFDLRLPGENSPFAIIINDGDEALKFCNASYKSMARFIKFNDENVQ